MSVLFDAATENVQAADPQEFTHTPTGTPRGVLVFIAHGDTQSDIVSGVTYGGVAMTRVAFGDDSTGEVGAGYLYFLGSSIPTGAQTVSINRTQGTTTVWACAITVTASGDTEVVDFDNSQQGDANIANPTVTLQHGGRDCLSFFGGYEGANSSATVDETAGQTRVHDHDFGSWMGVASRKDASSTTDSTLGYTVAANSLALIGVAVGEVAATGSTGSGSPTATLDASASGTATQSFSGSGTPSTSLSASASGTATNTEDANNASGSPTAALSASATGVATNTPPAAGDHNGSGSPTATLSASASGTATHSKDTVEASGDAETFLAVTADGTASLIFNGSGAPTATLSATVVAGVLVVGYEGPTFVGSTGPLVGTGDREIAWPGTNADPDLSLIQAGDVALLFVGTKNEVATLFAGQADINGDQSNFAPITGGEVGLGTVGAASAVGIKSWWSRATSHHMRSTTVADPGQGSIVGMVVYRGCISTGDPYDAVDTGSVSPASTELRAMPDFATLTANSRVVGAAFIALDASHPAGVGSGYTSTGVQNITERMDASFTSGNGFGLVVVDAEKLDVGQTGGVFGTLVAEARSAYVGVALRPVPAPTPSTGSGSPTATLDATASGTADQVANDGVGAPEVALVATASGAATVIFDRTASGAATAALAATASGAGSSTGVGFIVGSGSPTATLSASATGSADIIKPLYPTRPPRDPAVGGRARRIIYVEPEPVTKEPRPSRRRRPAAPPPTPEAQPLPSFEAPPIPAFTPYEFDPNLWRSLAAPHRPTVVTPDPREIEEEERFLAQLLDVI